MTPLPKSSTLKSHKSIIRHKQKKQSFRCDKYQENALRLRKRDSKTCKKTIFKKKTYKTLIMIVVLRTVNIILLKCLTNKFAVPLSK